MKDTLFNKHRKLSLAVLFSALMLITLLSFAFIYNIKDFIEGPGIIRNFDDFIMVFYMYVRAEPLKLLGTLLLIFSLLFLKPKYFVYSIVMSLVIPGIFVFIYCLTYVGFHFYYVVRLILVLFLGSSFLMYVSKKIPFYFLLISLTLFIVYDFFFHNGGWYFLVNIFRYFFNRTEYNGHIRLIIPVLFVIPNYVMLTFCSLLFLKVNVKKK